ncbi:MAG: hypothetical protein ABSF34_00870 [Verrucomicrobiota bacterium]
MSAGLKVQCSIFEGMTKNLSESPMRALQGAAIPPPIPAWKAIVFECDNADSTQSCIDYLNANGAAMLAETTNGFYSFATFADGAMTSALEVNVHGTDNVFNVEIASSWYMVGTGDPSTNVSRVQLAQVITPTYYIDEFFLDLLHTEGGIDQQTGGFQGITLGTQLVSGTTTVTLPIPDYDDSVLGIGNDPGTGGSVVGLANFLTLE